MGSVAPFYDSDDVTLYHGDCLDLMPLLDERFDMILADPPYGTTRNDWDRELPNKLLWANYDQLIASARTPVVMFASGSFGARLIVENLSRYRYTLIWEKNTVSGFLNAKRQPLRSHEDIIVFYAKQPTYNPQMVDTGRRSHSRGTKRERAVNHYNEFTNTEVADQDGQYPRSVLRYPRPKQGLHPSQKPLDLCRWLIRTYTNPGDLILDNVAGSATTLLAARLEGRRAIGIEAREDYCITARNRLMEGTA